nr:hypothetical protein [Tanacetum cinerariifolium]
MGKGKGKEAEHDYLKMNKDDEGKGKVHDIQNRVEKFEVDLARTIKAKQAEHDDDLDARDDDLDALNLKNRIKEIKEDFGRLLKTKEAKMEKEAKKVKETKLEKEAKKEKEADEAEFKAKEAMLAEVVQETPTTYIAPTASASNAQVASTSAPIGYMKIAMTGCVLGLRAPDDTTASPPSATRKRKSKK